MKRNRCRVTDLIDDKLTLMEFALNDCEVFINQHYKENFDPPPLWEDSKFAAWEDYRMNRRECYTNKDPEQRDDFPLAGFDINEYGAITIIKDDSTDLLEILKSGALHKMPVEYVKNVLFAADITYARLHYVMGYYQSDFTKNMLRTSKSKKSQQKNMELRIENVYKIFEDNYRNTDLELTNGNRLAIAIMEKYNDTNNENKTNNNTISLNTVKKYLRHLHKKGRISLPWMEK